MKGEMMFDAKKVKNDIVKWIEDWFENNEGMQGRYRNLRRQRQQCGGGTLC